MYLLDLLRNGGYTIYARHGEATIGDDLQNLNFNYCFTQRNLSPEGRRQAVYYGNILRNLKIPVCFPIQAGPFCRTIETAQLAFGSGNGVVQVDPFWYQIYKLSENLSFSELKNILDLLRARLEIKPPRGCNKVIIAHSFPAGMGLGEIPNMGTVIIKPLGYGKGYEVVGRFPLEELGNLQRF